MRLRLFPELPLLRRELTELAARRRTWVLRSLAALLLLGLAFWGVSSTLRMNGLANAQTGLDPRTLGIGAQFFPFLARLLFFTVQLLMPSLICGSITIEKERNTLGTLFVTRLSPLTIVLEKLGSRLLPMLSFMILTFPILAWVYTLGGIDHQLVLATLWLLIWECVLFASIGLVCSAWYSTTVGAFIASYVLTGLLITTTSVIGIRLPMPSFIWTQLIGSASFQQGLAFAAFAGPPGFGTPGVGIFRSLCWSTLPTAIASAVLVLLAKRFLVTRAEVSRASILLRIFRSLDAFFRNLNDWTTGGRMVIAESSTLPLFDPVAWRERAKKSLGKPHYLMRMLLVLQFPVLFVCVAAYESGSAGVTPLLWLLWLITAMFITVKAATLISSERTRETLDALLSTPLTNADILRQKISGMRRMMLVLAIPILTVHFSKLLMLGNVSIVSNRVMLGQLSWLAAYFLGSLWSTAILMQLIAWFALRLGARATTQARSFMLTLVALGLWFGASALMLPWGLQSLASLRDPALQYYRGFLDDQRFSTGHFDGILLPLVATVPGQSLLLACRPDGSIVATQVLLKSTIGSGWSERNVPAGLGLLRNEYTSSEALLLLTLVTTLQWGLYRLLRWRTCQRSDRLLGRVDEPEEPTWDRARQQQGTS
ncbi:MAG: hypothetical protein RLZZ436_3969 [Planctomycetota bacterium]